MKAFQTLVLALSLSTCFVSFGIQETWYWDFALGPSVASYNNVGSTKFSTDSRMGTGSDVSFYFPASVDGNTVVGPSISGVSSHYKSPHGVQSMLAFSLMRSFGKEPGEGFFLRGDVGLGTLQFDPVDTAAGFGFMAAAGYGFSISEQTRFILQGRLHLIFSSEGNGQAFSIVFGPMF